MLTRRELVPTPVNEYTQKIEEHLAYLRRMADENVVDRRLASKARTVWYVAWYEMDQALPVPAAATFMGGPIEFHWEQETHRADATAIRRPPCPTLWKRIKTDRDVDRAQVIDGPSRSAL